MKEGFSYAFQNQLRGTRELIKSRLRAYLPFIRPLKEIYPDAKMVDLGCGRGEWLELLGENGIFCQGVDVDSEMLAICQELGLHAKKGDALSFLKECSNESQTIISGFHLAEHIPFDDLKTLVEESLRVLKPAGLLILETPNPDNLIVATSTFYLDPQHKAPIPSDLLEFVPKYFGFEKIKIVRLNETLDIEKDENLSLTAVLSGVSPDYGLVAQKFANKELLTLTDDAFNVEYGITLETALQHYEGKLERELEKMKLRTQEAEASARQSYIAAGNTLKETEAIIEHTMSELASARDQLEAVYKSHSWKITSPLRNLKDKLGKKSRK